MKTTTVLGALGVPFLALAFIAASAGAAPAQVTSSPEPTSSAPEASHPVVSFAGPDVVRVDRQDPPLGVVVLGVARSVRVSVDFGDGTGVDVARVGCTPARAAADPTRCSASFSHQYTSAGSFTIRVRVGSRTESRPVTVYPKPLPWFPPEGWAQPPGWSMIWSSATFVPCEAVPWTLDTTGATTGRGSLHDDIVGGLARLATETGLAFTETPDPSQAKLTFTFADLGADGPSGRGGPRGVSLGQVTFNAANEWTKDEWAGLGMVTREWDADGLHWTWQMPGRGWLVIHETMHALGLGHVNDPTSVMNPSASVVAFNPGDLDGLHTMYRDNPCPSMP